MNVLSRAWARKSIICVVIGAATLLYGIYIGNTGGDFVAFLYLAVAVFIKYKFLCCPYCGKKGAVMPQWKKPGKFACKKCGHVLHYDDER